MTLSSCWVMLPRRNKNDLPSLAMFTSDDTTAMHVTDDGCHDNGWLLLDSIQISVDVTFVHMISSPPVFSNDGLSGRFSSKWIIFSGTGGVLSKTAPSETIMADLFPELSTAYTLL